MTTPGINAVLQGYTAIAEFLDMKPMYVKYLVKRDELPTFKRNGRVCAYPLALLEWARLKYGTDPD